MLYILYNRLSQNIFNRIDIIYYRLSYVSRGVLPLKTLTLFISVEMYNVIQIIIIHNLFFLHDNHSLVFFDHRSLPLP
jgi:hypothetical protein